MDLGRIKQVALPDGGGTFYLVPCRSTAFAIVSVAVLERAGALHVLTFPDPGFDWKGDFAGDFAAAASSAEHAIRLAPRDPTRYLSESAWATASFLVGQYDVCNDRAHAAIHANPRFI